MVDPYKILKRPMLTEKSTSLREMESPKFTFVVTRATIMTATATNMYTRYVLNSSSLKASFVLPARSF